MTLYAVWQDETRNLSETVKVGDFVDYPVDYSNANSSNLKGWRVLSIEDGVVKLISTGTPLTYTKGSSTYDDLVTNFINKTSSDFVTYGFTDTIKNTFNNLYITKVESVKESDILNITGNASISGIDVSNYGGVLNNNTAYLIPGESNIYYKNASNGNIAASEEITYGVRVVVTLSEHTQTSGKNIKGEWEINVPTYIVLYNANGGNVSITNSTTYKVEVVNGGKYYGTDFALPEATKEGCTFIGWFTEEGEKITESSIVDLEENTTLYARWNEIEKVAQAVYTAGNTTLTFVKRAPIAVGDTLNGHAVTAVYTGIEDTIFETNDDVPWYSIRESITTAVVEDTIQPLGTKRWFNNMSNLTSVDLAKLDTSKATTLRTMFQNCTSLTVIDVSHFKTENVTEMAYMFFKCGGVSSLDVSEWNTSKVTTMEAMFQRCTRLKTLDVSGWNTSKVTTMYSMFNECRGLTTLNVSGWNTQNVTDMSYMFNRCMAVTKLDLTNFNTSKVTNMAYMFDEMYKLQEITVGANFKFKGTTTATGSLPTPSSTYITGADGKWYNIATQTGYTAEAVAKLPTGETRTFTAIAPIAQALYLDADKSLRFVKTQPLTTSDTYDGKAITAIYTGIEEDTYEAQTDVPWNQYASVITTAIVEDTISPVSTRRWFNTMTNLTTADLTKLDTSKVTTMYAMFQYCINLTSLDLGHFDMSNVTNMAAMFLSTTSCGPMKLTTIGDVSNWNTSKVANMQAVFQNCSNLTTLDVSRKTVIKEDGTTYTAWDTSNVTDMSYMFNQCSGLTTLDVSNWDTSKVTTMRTMFQNCINLEILDVSNWNTQNVTDMSYMFCGAEAGVMSLTTLDVSEWDTSKVTKMTAMFQSCSNLTTLDVSNWDTTKVTKMTAMFQNCSNLTTLDVSTKTVTKADGTTYTAWDTSNVTDMSYMFNGCSGLTTLDISKWNTSKVTTMKQMFQNCSNLTTLDVSTKTVTKADGTTYTAWDTSNVTDMGYMFKKCTSLTTLDVSEWDTSKVTTMYAMFQHCINLTSLDLGHFDMSNVTDMTAMFLSTDSVGSMKLTTIGDVSDWNTSKVTTMHAMFQNCSNLKTLNLSNWDTSLVESMYFMFGNCSSLTALDISKWNTSKVTTMKQMFQKCSNLTTLDVSNWDTSNVTDMGYMFNKCTSLTTLDVSEWDTSKVTTMRTMFQNCVNLTTLDLSNWNTVNVTDMAYMFYGMNKLQEIKLGSNFKFLSTAITPGTGSLPTPSNSYITGADGKWYNKVTGAEYTAAQVAGLATGEARTFVAVDPKVAIRFEANGGNVTGYNSTSVTLSGMPGLAYSQIDYGNGLPEAYWDGYEFIGWYTAATNGTKVTADSTIGNSNHTLYAQWKKTSIPLK